MHVQCLHSMEKESWVMGLYRAEQVGRKKFSMARKRCACKWARRGGMGFYFIYFFILKFIKNK